MASNKYRAGRCILVGLIALSTGCSALDSQQKFSNKAHEISVPEQWLASDEFVNEELTDQLLDLVDDPEVRQLVQQSLQANYDLRVTAARLRQSQLLNQQAQLNTDPSLTTNYQASRSKQGQIANSQSLSLDLSWELDVWGSLADASDAAFATAQENQLDYLYARSSLAAQVIQAWLDINYRAQMIEVEEHWVTSLIHTEEIIREQVLDGEKEQADLDAAMASTARTRATLIARKQEQAIAIRNLNVLRGSSSQALTEVTSSPISVKAPPVQVPGSMIGSRPDLLAAYQAIVAADKNTAVAYKALLPKFTLTASVSRTGETMTQLLDGSSAWNLIGGVTAPLFNRETLKIDVQSKELDAEVAYLNYQKRLLNAMIEVENAFDKEASLKAQALQLSQAHAHSFASMRDYQNLYQDGASDVLTLLIAKQTAFQAKIQLLETEQARFSNRITLGLALGMGI